MALETSPVPWLGGATESLRFTSKRDVARVVSRLNTCIRHGGVHHFAVVGEGHTVYMSEHGMDCIKDILETLQDTAYLAVASE